MTFDEVLQAALASVGGIVTVGGGSAAIAYGFFGWFGKSWLDQQFKQRLEQLKHDQQKEIEQLRLPLPPCRRGAIPPAPPLLTS
jgi:hypothetical protein